MAVIFPPATGGGGEGGVSVHGQLAGLSADDHLQYHNDARGDARYYTQLAVENLLSGKSDVGHTHSVDDLNASGTPDSSVYLRGDGTWASPSGSTSFINQDIPLDADTERSLYFTINDDGTPTGPWPDRLRFVFHPQAGVDVQTWWNNEYGEARGTPAKPNTVGHRLFVGTGPAAYAARDMTVPVFEIASDRTDRVRKFAVYGDGDVDVAKDLAVTGTVTAENVAQRVETHPTGTPVPVGTPDGTLWVEYTP